MSLSQLWRSLLDWFRPPYHSEFDLWPKGDPANWPKKKGAQMKLYCARCQIYLGQSKQSPWAYHADEGNTREIICPICEETVARTKLIISGDPIGETEYPTDRYFSWPGHVAARNYEDTEAIHFIRLIMERREQEFYEFPKVEKVT